jgi:hypothetical protein
MRPMIVVAVVRVVLFRVSRYAKWFSCPLVYCQGALISNCLGLRKGKDYLLSLCFARDGPQIGLWYLHCYYVLNLC